MSDIQELTSKQLNKKYIEEVISDYSICCLSREVSMLTRKLVLGGKGKFGISGDGKEVPQVAMARAFKKGDFRSGYYRDFTFILAAGIGTVEDYFAQLFADPDNDPFSFGRQMNSHFATKLANRDGSWVNHLDSKNVTSDISPTGGQMARGLGIALASKLYRASEVIPKENNFSNNGNEVSFCTIGDASTSEGVFWETMNAAGVQQVPLAVSVWDDGYGISVPKEYQTTKGSISELMEGFYSAKAGEGFDIYVEDAWNYPVLVEMYKKGIKKVRKTHKPALFHIQECTQPNGHSTSGSHERYKSKERLQWEIDFDCIQMMRKWMIDNHLAKEKTLVEIEENAKKEAKAAADKMWLQYTEPCIEAYGYVTSLFQQIAPNIAKSEDLKALEQDLHFLVQKPKKIYPLNHELVTRVRKALYLIGQDNPAGKQELIEWLTAQNTKNRELYNTELHIEGVSSALSVPSIPPVYNDDSKEMQGFQILNNFFDHAMEKNETLFAFGEDLGKIGDVNQGFAGLQDKYGEARIFDTGIREWTIIGQGIGMAMRGMRPIAEVQYIDYLLYALVPLSDDLATLRYRSKGMQQAPMIIRTRGHRLEGIWHTGSPIGMMLHSLRGIYICVPRNTVQAAGMYNTLLQSNDPSIVVECLNGYRIREKLPANMGEYTIPLGVPDILSEGNDVTLVTYGSCVRIASKAVKELAKIGISVELVDVQTLLPFDLNHVIRQSLQKTSRLLVLDEDVPGGASSYILQQILEEQDAYYLLDSKPITLAAAPHRAPSGSDGDYYSKPSAEDVYEAVYKMMHEADPATYPTTHFT